MKNYTITVNGNVYEVTVEEGSGNGAAAAAPAPKAARSAGKKSVAPSNPSPVALPSITLDAILPGANPVAILKYRGESAVVSVGQEAWGATVIRIREDSVKLRMGSTEFEAVRK